MENDSKVMFGDNQPSQKLKRKKTIILMIYPNKMVLLLKMKLKNLILYLQIKKMIIM